MDPLIEWDKAAQQELVAQRAVLAEQGASLHLASAERDGLLRENDKIIAHYKKVRGTGTRLLPAARRWDRPPKNPLSHQGGAESVKSRLRSLKYFKPNC